GHPFSRSYGVRLPSSLTGNRSSTWGSSPPPTSVGVRYGRCKHILRLEAFLGGLRITRHFRALFRHSRPASGSTGTRICLGSPLPRPASPGHSGGCRSAPRPPFPNGAPVAEWRPARHPLRPPLVPAPWPRTRLTLGRLPLPRNPQASGVDGSHIHSR